MLILYQTILGGPRYFTCPFTGIVHTTVPFRRPTSSPVKAIHWHICLHEFMLSERKKLLPANYSQGNATWCQNVGKQEGNPVSGAKDWFLGGALSFMNCKSLSFHGTGEIRFFFLSFDIQNLLHSRSCKWEENYAVVITWTD